MESLQVRTGQMGLKILDDFGNERGIFKFNPEDINSAKAVLSIQKQMPQFEAEYDKKVKAAKTDEDKIKCLDETVIEVESLIDQIFGAGSSDVLFGGAKTLSMFFDFFDGIQPYYDKAAKNRVAKYSKYMNKKSSK